VLGDRRMPAAQKRERIRALTLEALDFDALARLSMGRHWRDLSEGQRRDFTEAFKQHLINTCCEMTSGFSDERVTVIGPCTKCSPDFCSYRRDGADAGRQVSFIGWT